MKILWIDDDEWRSKPLKDSLELYDWEINFYSDYEKSYNDFEKIHAFYQAVIIDIMMPPGKMFKNENDNVGTITGLLLYKKIRNLNKEIPILMYTVLRDKALLNKYINGDNKVAWLNKPASAEEIITKINNLI
jgi:DNA-binding response OmpR family regulator